MKKINNVGFTLLELMLVVAIAGVLASIAVPSFSKMIERNRLKEAAESLKSDLMFARTEAIKQSQDIIVNRDTSAWCYGLNIAKDLDADGEVDDGCDCTQTDDTQADYCSLKRVLGSTFTQTNLASTSGNTTFSFRRGTANAGNTCFSTTTYKLRVKVSNTGRVTVCTNTGSASVIGYESCPADQQC